MSFVSISDIAKCANFTFKLYQYGFTEIYNANAQYTEFGQSVHALYTNLHQLEIIFEKVQSIPPCPIPGTSSFYDTRDLNAILDDPYTTVQECSRLLTRRDCFEEKGGFIRNIIWHGFVQDEVTLLHKKVMFHNIKILALLKPLELKLLLDIQPLVIHYGEAMLLVLGRVKELILGDAQAVGAQQDVRCRQIVIPPYLLQKFEKLSVDAKPRAGSDDTFPMHDGINAFLQHFEEEATVARLSRSRDVQPPSPTQWSKQYVSMMRSIWILQRIQSSAEYVESCTRANQLLKYFVEDLEKKCLYAFNQHSDRPTNPYRVKNEPDELSLRLLGEEVFFIWPILVRSYDRLHPTEIDDLKTILRTPLHNLNPERQKSLVLLRQTENIVEMITKETSIAEQTSKSRSRGIDLRVVTLSPIYADPQKETSGIDIGIYTSGMTTHDNILSFQTYQTLYSFQEAITGYRVVDDLIDIDVIVMPTGMADKPTRYKARVQIWNFAPNLPTQSPLPTPYDNSPPATSENTIRARSNSNASMATTRRQTSNDSSARFSSPRKSTFPSSISSYYSPSSSFSMSSPATTNSDLTSLSDPRDSNTEAFIFESLREPLLVLFLRPEKPPPSRTSRGEMGDSDGGLTLLKIPIGALKAVLDKKNCSCQKGGIPCTHSSIMGPAKRFGTGALMSEWWRGKMVNLAALGAHYDDPRGGGEKEKLNHVKMTFNGEGGRERKKKFEKMVAGVQEVDRRKRYLLEEEKVGLRLRGETLWPASKSQNRSTQVTFGNQNTGFQLGVGNSLVSGISFEGKGTKDTYGRTQLFAPEKELGKEVKLLVPAISQDKLRESVNSDVSPETMQSTLAGGRIEDIKMLLDQHFSSVAKEDFIWLQELREHGYETEEIAQLLATEQNDSPWIYFEPRHLPREVIIPDHHEAFCVHMGGQEVRHGTGSISSTTSMDRKDYRLSWTSDNESLTYIEEFCGIAGVVPNTRDISKQVGSVKFVEEDGTLTASVSFHFDSKAEKAYTLSGHNDRALSKVAVEHSSNILQALGNLCSAIAHAQRSGICCDSFTVLQFSIISAQEVIELCHIRVSVILDLYSKFASFIANPGVKGGNIQHLMLDALESGKGIFQEATLSSFTTATFEGILDYYSLAVQFLSLGFSSYVKAHVGAIQPFFLDTSLSVIKLFGLQDKERQSPRLIASLHRLTCLDDMIQNPVLVFGEGQAKKQETQKSYDLLASPEDLVDTWGPGQFVTSSSTTGTHNLTAIMIGGGVVKPTAENTVLHWSSNVEPRHKFSVHFSKTEKVLIAGGVEVNTACQSNRTEIWSSFIGSLENLGTAADYWQFTEFQAGVAVMGQQFAGGQLQFNKTWTWHPGNSWKRQHLSLIADELPFNELDRPWGLQVSACTGVARRVPLRLLLADTMPTFAGNLALSSGWTTLQQRGIIEALEKGSQTLKQWYDELCNLPNFQDLQILTKRLIRYILLVLRDTGIDRDHKTFLIACPQGYLTGQPISMCLPVPCENASSWAKILRDSENCATFACMTNLCLESQEHKCHQTHPWHCPSLDTAVQQLRLRKEPITMSPQAWNLEVDSLYWIGIPESGLQARVVKSADSPFPRLHISKSGVPEKTRARLGTMSRLFGPKMNRLREKQIETWPAEDVLVLSQSK